MLGRGFDPPPDVIHIRVLDKTLMGKNRMHKGNRLLHEVHRNLWAIRFRFREDVVDDLLHEASEKMDRGVPIFAMYLIDTSDWRCGHIADLGCDEVHGKKGVLQPLPYTAGVVDDEIKRAREAL